MWQINMPNNASIFIEQVRNLAFFEFVTDWIFVALASTESECESEDDSCNTTTNQSGIEKTGSDSFLKNAGFMAVAGIGLLIALVALAVLFAIGLKSQRVNKLYRTIKQHLFWNGLIRYIL